MANKINSILSFLLLIALIANLFLTLQSSNLWKTQIEIDRKLVLNANVQSKAIEMLNNEIEILKQRR